MKKFMVYLDDGKDCYKLAIPAKNEKEAREYVAGNGEVIAVKDVTEEFYISRDKVSDALKLSHFGDFEIDFCVRALIEMNICE